VLYTYGGWNDAALVAAEIKDRRRNIPRALILGTLLLTVIYLAVNGAYLAGLGFNGARSSSQIAADLVQSRVGSGGASAISLLVIISALGAINGLIYTGSRIYSSMGADFRLFSRLARWDGKRQAPITSLAWQGVITLGLILLVGTSAGRASLDWILGPFGVKPAGWEGHGGFDTLLRCTAPVFWLFFLGTGISLFVLRFREPNQSRPFKVPLYPVLPLIFCAMCAYMLYSATAYAGKLLIVGVIPLLMGLITYLLGRNSASIVPSLAQQTIKQETTT
jgi:amino acid transporter